MRIEEKTTAALFDELSITNIKCFFCQERVMHGKTDGEVAKAAKAAQRLNARRNALVRAIEKRLGESDVGALEKTYG